MILRRMRRLHVADLLTPDDADGHGDLDAAFLLARGRDDDVADRHDALAHGERCDRGAVPDGDGLAQHLKAEPACDEGVRARGQSRDMERALGIGHGAERGALDRDGDGFGGAAADRDVAIDRTGRLRERERRGQGEQGETEEHP
jgi:hypothetical protein